MLTVSILTNGSRANQLSLCLNSLFAYTIFPKNTTFRIVDNGSTDYTRTVIANLREAYAEGTNYQWQVVQNEKDLGCVAGTNQCFDTEDEYHLHIESDFTLIPTNGTWLLDAIKKLENFDYIYLRRMRNKSEADFHWFCQWFPKMREHARDFVECPNFWWSNNPALFNLKKLKQAGILPLNSIDGPKGSPLWSKAELEAGKIAKSLIHRYGLFVHEIKDGEIFSYKDEWCQFWDKQMERKMEKRIIGFENGLGYDSFKRIVEKIDCPHTLYRIGLSYLYDTEIVPNDFKFQKNDIAFFPIVGHYNQKYYRDAIEAGIPIVVHNSFAHGIEHEKNGWKYIDESWAIHWLNKLSKMPEIEAMPEKQNIVTVITPTIRRDIKVVKRVIDCIKLQTLSGIKHIVCSDGVHEIDVERIARESGAEYRVHNGKNGEFGNYLRQSVLETVDTKFVCFVDDDNIIVPEYMEKMVKAIEENDADYAVCQVVHFGPVNEIEIGKPPLTLKTDNIKLYHVDTLQFVVKTEVMKKVGWNTDKGYLADGYTFENLSRVAKKAEVKETLGFHM